MIKATGTTSKGRKLLMLGLSFDNLDTLRAQPGETYVRIDGAAMGLPVDVLIFSGETEAALHKKLEAFIGPETVVHVDPKLKS